jgi:hypothetical protein
METKRNIRDHRFVETIYIFIVTYQKKTGQIEEFLYCCRKSGGIILLTGNVLMK